MRGTGKILAVISTLTFFSLLYVHEQIVLFRISYEMARQADVLDTRSEEYRRLAFDVESLKAPRLLETRLKELSLDLALPSEIQVVRIPDIPMPEMPSPSVVTAAPFSQGWGDFLGRWVKVAQAKTDS